MKNFSKLTVSHTYLISVNFVKVLRERSTGEAMAAVSPFPGCCPVHLGISSLSNT